MDFNLYRLTKLFIEPTQYLRLFDLANDSKVCFEGQISELPLKYKVRRIIMIEPIEEDEYFDGYLNIYIATENDDEYFAKYYDVEDED